MKSEIVKRKPTDLKPDPNQPRKKFDQDAIKNLAQTMKTQGIINPIEIDENNVIITGELRWRASKIVFKNGKMIKCKKLTEISKIERFERQTIENVHHNALKDDDLGDAIRKLWKMGNTEIGDKRYKSREDMSKKIGLDPQWTRDLIRLLEAKKELNLDKLKGAPLKTSTIAEIDRKIKNKVDKQKIAKKAVEEKLTRDQVREVIKTTKILPKDIKDEVLKPKSNITLNEAKDLTKVPEDVRKEVFKKDITIEEAKEVAEFPKVEQRKAIIKQIKQTKQAGKKIIQQKKDIIEGKRPIPIKKIDLDMKFIEAWKNTKIKDIPIKIRKSFLDSYSKDTKQECLRIVKSVINYLIKEFSEDVKFIE